MTQFTRELLAVEREGIDLRAGVLGLLVLTAFAAAIALVGPVAMAAAVGALVVLSTDPPPAGRAWTIALMPLIISGAVLTFLAVWLDGNAIAGALLGGIVGLAATLQAGRSTKAGARGLIATIWVILGLTLYDSGVTPLEYSLAFVAGAAVGTLAALSRARSGPPEGAGADDVEGHVTGATIPSFGALLKSPLGLLAVLRGIGIGVAIWVGFMWFPSHPAWVAITALIVIRPPTHQAVLVGLQRSLGTCVGVIGAVALAGIVGETTAGLVVLFLATAFLMMSVREVNYALFAMLAAALVVFLERILQGNAAETAFDRFAATVTGVAIAFVILGLVDVFRRARRSDG